MKVKIEFSGGAELLFDNKTEHEVEIEKGKTLKDLIQYLARNMLREKPELFIQGDTVRPGILVLVNDTDWELLDTLEYQIQENDTIAFISTLHGG
eukprot:Clim_evm19s238 gene=Clim_evmTU19s238